MPKENLDLISKITYGVGLAFVGSFWLLYYANQSLKKLEDNDCITHRSATELCNQLRVENSGTILLGAFSYIYCCTTFIALICLMGREAKILYADPDDLDEGHNNIPASP